MKAALTLLALGFIAGCSDRGTVPISDVTSTNAFTLTSRRGSVSGITLHVRGQLDGTGYIYASNWETNALSGKIDWLIYHDWFETNCTVQYRPEGVRAGTVTIGYEFH